MGVQFSKTFGALANPVATTMTTTPKVPAKYWLNFGYLQDIENPTTGEIVPTFVAMPGGIPLDTVKRIDVTKGTKYYVALGTARNQLLDDILEACSHMTPGEDKYIGEAGGLQFQLHMVKDEAETVPENENPFRRKFNFS